jgi:hypothetical protein
MAKSDDETDTTWTIYGAPEGVDFCRVPVSDDDDSSDDEIVELDHGETVRQSDLLEDGNSL